MPTRQKQHVRELQFYLYDRPLHPELFDIYHNHRIVKEAYEVQVWITGTSHLIGFYRGPVAITELIAETKAVLPTRGRLAAIPMRGEKEHEFIHLDGVRYMMNFQVEIMSPRLYAQTHQELSEQGAKGGLFVPFPEWAANNMTPFVYIDYEAKPRQFHVFAYHAFPEELTVIKTQTIFELNCLV